MLRAARLAFVVLLALTLQTTWMADLRPLAVTGDLLLLLSIGAGLSSGPVTGAVVGFVSGMAIDLVLYTPLGLSALVYMAVGYGVGVVHQGVLRSAPWIPLAVAFVATFLGIGMYVMLGQLVGEHFRTHDIWWIMLVTSVIHTLLVLPVRAVTDWIERAAPDHLVRAMR